ncbi:sterol desaturase [Marinobacter sp. NP-4(2019)]|uniref:sterol desaturase family protein n=1 Tax=Marinobacter sp. NP-4(2019) TaxID=2488665 RepID=UPI000FC3E486|nr:sterol desaturase family protein [Marinobacter sp. NP-4(2019)]AZT82365.1 sterol desaturase [Marinobacter sp. NP-4(2019)]
MDDQKLTMLVTSFIVLTALWEVVSGRTREGRKSKQDWRMAFLATFMMVAVQRPLVLLVLTLVLSTLIPGSAGSLAWLEQAYFWPTLIVFFCVEEFIHGSFHLFAHRRRPNNRVLQWIQAFYKMSHRPHHMSGGLDNKGQLSVTQTFVNGWAWWLIMPNYTFQLLCLYLGLVDVFLIATAFKGLWAAHTHVNWNYDLYFHNHRWAWVRKTMWALAHILVFPTQHHHHHARGPNSAKNVTSTLAIYDWLVFGTLAIETSKPKVYGWRQKEQEANSVLKRYFCWDVRPYVPKG